MNNGKKTLTITKRYQNRISAEVVERAIHKGILTGINRGAENSGWKHQKPVLTALEHTDHYLYTAEITFIKHSMKEYAEETFEHQWKGIARRFLTKMKNLGWASPSSVAEGLKNVTDDSPKAVFGGADSIAIPKDWKKHFEHIYDRDTQILEILESLRTAKETNMDIRNHVLANGPPGCGKTETLLAVARMLGHDNVKRLDATATTKAGAENLLLEMDVIPPVLIIEELEKCNEQNLPWLLGILDDRGEIIKTNARTGSVSRVAKCLVLTTVNNMDKFRNFQEGALVDRFTVPLYFPMPDEALLKKVLKREVAKIPGGKVEWIQPALEYAIRVEKTYQARRIKAIMTNARDRLLDGSFQAARKEMLDRQEQDREDLKKFNINT